MATVGHLVLVDLGGMIGRLDPVDSEENAMVQIEVALVGVMGGTIGMVETVEMDEMIEMVVMVETVAMVPEASEAETAEAEVALEDEMALVGDTVATDRVASVGMGLVVMVVTGRAGLEVTEETETGSQAMDEMDPPVRREVMVDPDRSITASVPLLALELLAMDRPRPVRCTVADHLLVASAMARLLQEPSPTPHRRLGSEVLLLPPAWVKHPLVRGPLEVRLPQERAAHYHRSKTCYEQSEEARRLIGEEVDLDLDGGDISSSSMQLQFSHN